ncbi:uncharacterized protein A4U43_C05F17300, partial [Asparagus officinalis]
GGVRSCGRPFVWVVRDRERWRDGRDWGEGVGVEGLGAASGNTTPSCDWGIFDALRMEFMPRGYNRRIANDHMAAVFRAIRERKVFSGRAKDRGISRRKGLQRFRGEKDAGEGRGGDKSSERGDGRWRGGRGEEEEGKGACCDGEGGDGGGRFFICRDEQADTRAEGFEEGEGIGT